jgi:WD40 repeat protein
MLQNCTLVGHNAKGSSFQGISVDINYDGSVIAIGGTGDDSGIGACWLFKDNISHKLVGSNHKGIPFQGIHVAITFDGLHLAVAGNNDNFGNGSVWIYDCTSYTELCQLTGTHKFGSHLAFNCDGSMLCIGSENKLSIYDKTYTNIMHIDTTCSVMRMNVVGRKIFATDGNDMTITQYDDTFAIVRKIHIDMSKIYDFGISENGHTIMVTGSCCDKIYTQCYVLIDGKYHMIYSMSPTHHYTNMLPCAVSLDGKICVLGVEMDDSYSGSCIIIS